MVNLNGPAKPSTRTSPLSVPSCMRSTTRWPSTMTKISFYYSPFKWSRYYSSLPFHSRISRPTLAKSSCLSTGGTYQFSFMVPNLVDRLNIAQNPLDPLTLTVNHQGGSRHTDVEAPCSHVKVFIRYGSGFDWNFNVSFCNSITGKMSVFFLGSVTRSKNKIAWHDQ